MKYTSLTLSFLKGLRLIKNLIYKQHGNNDNTFDQRTFIITNFICLIFFLSSVTAIAIDLFVQFYEIIFQLSVFSFIVLIIWYINNKGFHLFAKIMLLILANLLVVFMVLIEFKQNKRLFYENILYFFILTIIPYVLCGQKEKIIRYIFSFLPMLVYVGIKAYIFIFFEKSLMDKPPAILFMNIVVVFLIINFILSYFYRLVIKAENNLTKEKEKSDTLLLNTLPKSIVKELKRNNEVITKYYSEASILFADIVGFTNLSSGNLPQQIVGMLNNIFSDFDSFIEKYGLEKIKTIGDAYMVAGNVPELVENHIGKIINLAFDFQETVRKVNFEKYEIKSEVPLNIRIGIHIGPVIGGVIGVNKFTYDVWGDTVNIASRMESSGEAGRIQISGDLYEKIKHEKDYNFIKRGNIAIKGKGPMETYFIERKSR